jgi:hypothetical protein
MQAEMKRDIIFALSLSGELSCPPSRACDTDFAAMPPRPSFKMVRPASNIMPRHRSIHRPPTRLHHLARSQPCAYGLDPVVSRRGGEPSGHRCPRLVGYPGKGPDYCQSACGTMASRPGTRLSGSCQELATEITPSSDGHLRQNQRRGGHGGRSPWDPPGKKSSRRLWHTGTGSCIYLSCQPIADTTSIPLQASGA